MRLGLRFIIATLAAGAPLITGSQQPQQFRAQVDVIQLDVTVLDKQRHPVRGLTADDFTVMEDGKRQTVSVFKAIDIPAAGSPATGTPPAGRLIVLLLDDALIPFVPQMVNSVKDIGHKIVASLGPSDLASVVHTRALRQNQTFTRDRAALLRAIDGFTGIGGPGGDIANVNMMHTLADTAAQLADVTGWRKIAVLVSVGAPVDPADRNPLRTRVVGQFTEMTSAIEQAHRANVTFFAVDPGGLGGLEEFLFDFFRKRNNPDPAGIAHKQATLSSDFLHIVSRNTGGDVVAGTNDFAPGIAKIFDQTGAFYVIGYTSTNTKADGKFRKIDVKVNRKDVDVKTRDGYNAPK